MEAMGSKILRLQKRTASLQDDRVLLGASDEEKGKRFGMKTDILPGEENFLLDIHNRIGHQSSNERMAITCLALLRGVISSTVEKELTNNDLCIERAIRGWKMSFQAQAYVKVLHRLLEGLL